MKNPLAIFCADIHLRDSVPKARTDDFWESQWRKIDHIRKLQGMNNNCPVICSGDLFHISKPSNHLIKTTIEHIPFMYLVPGQHDLPNHRINQIEKAGIGVLEAAGSIKIVLDQEDFPNFLMKAFAFGHDITTNKKRSNKPILAVMHRLVIDNMKSAWPGFDGLLAEPFLKSIKGYDCILSGDNHKTFVKKGKRTTLVNPGSMTRQNSDQGNHIPSVFIWYDDMSIEQVILPCSDNVLSHDHLLAVKDKENRIEAFVKRLDDDYEVGLSFDNNLKTYFETNRTRSAIEELVWESVGE